MIKDPLLRMVVYYIDKGLYGSVLVNDLANDEELGISVQEAEKAINDVIEKGYVFRDEDDPEWLRVDWDNLPKQDFLK